MNRDGHQKTCRCPLCETLTCRAIMSGHQHSTDQFTEEEVKEKIELLKRWDRLKKSLRGERQ